MWEIFQKKEKKGYEMFFFFVYPDIINTYLADKIDPGKSPCAFPWIDVFFAFKSRKRGGSRTGLQIS